MPDHPAGSAKGETMKKSIIENRVAQFGRHMQAGTKHLYEACCIYAKTIMDDYTAADAFCKAYPMVSKTTWDKMRLVGVNAIEPTLLLLSDRLCGKLARLPIKDQKVICAAKIKVVRPSGRVVAKGIREFTREDEKRVFADGMKVLTVPEQRKGIKKKANRAFAGRPYSVEGETLRVFRACVISMNEIAAILNKIRRQP